MRKLTVIPGRPVFDDNALELVEGLLEQIKSGDVRSVCYVGLKDTCCSFGIAGEDELLTLLGSVQLLAQKIGDILNSPSEEE